MGRREKVAKALYEDYFMDALWYVPWEEAMLRRRERWFRAADAVLAVLNE